ncbi:MAG: AI-2E family transporter [Oscillospiraceae bacterium]|nr:AI-2E family transporter [Oscillospiraceae bacterium]
MNFKPKKKYLMNFIVIISSVTIGICLLSIFININQVFDFIKNIFSILSPTIFSFIIAFLLNPILNFIETNIFNKIFKNKQFSTLTRSLSILFTLLFTFLIIFLILIMIIPQLVQSVSTLIDNTPLYLQKLEIFINDIKIKYPFIESFLKNQSENISSSILSFKDVIIPYLTNFILSLTGGAINIIIFIKDILIGIIISIYIMMDKEKFIAQFKKIVYAVFPKDFAQFFLLIGRDTKYKFTRFISGKILDSFIIAIICFVGLSFLSMPYALLISIIIGITNIIPFFGPFIGAIPSGVLILIIDPIKAVWFFIFILALQQFDGNVLGPKILGDCTGLSSFWVIFSILLFGGLFGFVGMFIAVPIFAVIYSLIKVFVEYRLETKKFPTDTEIYKNKKYKDLF